MSHLYYIYIYSSEILVHMDTIASRSCCRFVGCTSMMWISRSTTSQRCSIGLRSGDCGCYLSKVNSLSCSRNLSEIIWALWHGALRPKYTSFFYAYVSVCTQSAYKDVRRMRFAPNCNTSPGLAGPVGSSYEDYSVTKDTEEKLIEVW